MVIVAVVPEQCLHREVDGGAFVSLGFGEGRGGDASAGDEDTRGVVERLLGVQGELKGVGRGHDVALRVRERQRSHLAFA